MNNSVKLLKTVTLCAFVAIGVVISPLLRVEGMCPTAHFINIVCSVLLGPWYSLLCAVLIGIIRMTVMGIPPLALTGAIFGAFLSGVFYRASKGRIIFAVLGEIFGTGIIGAVISYPVMSILMGREGLSLFFYVPSFTCGTLIGGSIAFLFLKKLSSSGVLATLQSRLGSMNYNDNGTVLSDSLCIASIGVIFYILGKVLASLFATTAFIWNTAAYISLAFFIVASLIYIFFKRRHTK